MMGQGKGHTEDKKWESLSELVECSFAIFNKLYTLKWCSGWFYTLFSWSYLMFYCIWQSFFSTLSPWRSGWGSLPWEHLLEAFMPILLHLNPSWNHWSVSVWFSLNLSPYNGMYRSFPKAVSFLKCTISHQRQWPLQLDDNVKGREVLSIVESFWWLDKPMVSFPGVFCFSTLFSFFHSEDLKRG